MTIGEQSDDASTAEGASQSRQQLIDMGYSQEHVELALKNSNNNLEQAAEFLLDKLNGGSRRNRRNDRKQNQRTRKRKTSLT